MSSGGGGTGHATAGADVGAAVGRRVGFGIIGGGLMGKELASAMARWFALEGVSDRPELVAVCDVNPATLEWFRRVPTVEALVTDHRQLLADPRVEAVYVAIPHDQHERVYIDVLEAGKDLLAEKPFGVDRRAAGAIRDSVARTGRFVRVSSEFPFLPAMYRAYQMCKSGRLGRLIDVRSAFLHASDMDPKKPVNWKRQTKHCGEIGVLGDLGMHPLHVPLKLGWRPVRVHAQLSNIYSERPDGRGGMAACDTWDNAILNTDIVVDGHEVPMRVEMKRLSPGDTNNWLFEANGTEGGVRFSTREPRTLWLYERAGDQAWRRVDMGFETPFTTITGKIFEPGFPDILQQMLAAFVAERAGGLGDRLACVTVDEAVFSHDVFAAALTSHRERRVVTL
jgi:predicted dehydrogenase